MKEMISRYIYILLMAALIFCMSSIEGPGIRAAEAAEGVVTGGVVNVRSGPGTNYTVAGSLYKDTAVDILSQSGEWYQIKYGNVSGWLHKSLLETEESAMELTVSKDQVNLRSGPGTTYAVIGEARQGNTLTLIEVVGEWYKAKTKGGQVVYIRADMTGTADTAAEDSGNASIDNLAPIITTPAVTSPAPAALTPAKVPSITLDGQTMKFEVAPVVENNRVLVPLRAIFEAMGATVVWNQATQTATATLEDTKVVLPLNSTSPTVNGQVWTLDVPARVVQQRTLAPLRFVGEALGGSASWDSNNYQVILASQADNGADVVAVTVTSQLVNLRSGPATSYLLVGTAGSGERLAVLDETSGWYQVNRGGDKVWVAGWLVDVVREGDPSAAPVSSPIADPEHEPAVTLAGLSISSQRSEDGLQIIMESGQKLSTDIEKTSGLISYEFDNRQIEGAKNLQEYLGYAQVNVSGTNSDRSAVVKITYPVGVQYRTTTENDGRREVFTIPNYISGVSRKTFGSSGENITISSIAPMEYTSTTTSTKLEIGLSNTLIGEAQASYKFSSPLISSMTVKSQTVGGKTGTVLSISTSKLVKFAVGTSNDDCILNILFVDQSAIQDRTSTIILDAGHGGRDPGASGATLAEEDVNLKIVLKAGKLLTEEGYKVVYTRSDDTYLSLDERTTMANLYNGAVFVSVHNNANVSSTPSGTETYCYYPLSDPNLYLQKEERYNLAQRLQEALVDELGRIDRGVKQGNLAVLRETEMPSALVEVVFISNPAEEALLKQESFLSKAAQAIFEGISGWMEDYA